MNTTSQPFSKNKAANSQTVISNQSARHENLSKIVLKHLHSVDRRPISALQRQQFERAWNWQQGKNLPFILDVGCGTGLSSFQLAKHHPQQLVIAIDQSAHRLRDSAQYSNQCNNLMFIQARLEEFWLLAEQAQWRPRKQYIFYPNPWPKKKHLCRRWHGHAIFPVMLKVCPTLELRTNWSIYAEEFQLALGLAGIQSQLCRYQNKKPVSLFEAKYLASNHKLYQIVTSP